MKPKIVAYGCVINHCNMTACEVMMLQHDEFSTMALRGGG